MIPANIDYLAMLGDLNGWGIRDYKIEAICGLGKGHVAQLKCGAIKDMKYSNAARIYNFWLDEKLARETPPSRETESSLPLAATTT